MTEPLFVAFEGGEGAGKSTQVGLLADWLASQGHAVVVTREPGGTPISERIRALLLDPDHTEMTDRAEALLYAAARAQHVAEVIRPAIESGTVVLTDRYVDSSLAYQGAGRSLAVDEIADVNAWATGGLVPDLTVVLDIDPAVGLVRSGSDDRLEREPLEFHQRVRAGFLRLAEAAPERYLVVDALAEREVIAAAIRQALQGVSAP